MDVQVLLLHVRAMEAVVVSGSLLAHHGVGLSCASVAVDKHSAVDALKRRDSNLADSLFVDFEVGVSFVKNSVEFELVLLVHIHALITLHCHFVSCAKMTLGSHLRFGF